ncbi:MAG TPA: endonuclease/exonuclease/phosphatase family protein [Chthoniobacterales bacterium]|nr:endonuclease/exonuclease/phosphatase family protein [Chthoniobacterales bacterium]
MTPKPLQLGAWLAGTAVLGLSLSRYLNYHPRQIEPLEPNNRNDPPLLGAGQRIKVVTFNVQFLAGTGYHFFYDGGPDTVVDRNDIEAVAASVGRFIERSGADLVLLQEVDCGARRTAYVNELALLRRSFPTDLQNHVAAYYWKSRFVPHPKILGSAGTMLVLFSRYRIASGRRYQLPLTPGNLVDQDFNLKRAMLEVELPLTNGKSITILNTHLEAFPKRTNVMERQLQSVLERLDRLSRQNQPWLIAGDFNLLPPGQSARLRPENRGKHREPSELGPLYERYHGIPPIPDATGDQMRRCFTFTQKSGTGRIPVRTLDYIFTSPTITPCGYLVPEKEMIEVSDHLPLIAEFTLPDAG